MEDSRDTHPIDTDAERNGEIIPSPERLPELVIKDHLLKTEQEFTGEAVKLQACDTSSSVAVFETLENYFRAWRRKLLMRNYLNRQHGNMREATPEGMIRYVEEAGNNTDRYCGYRGIPGDDFFRVEMFPAIAELAETPEDLLRIGKDAIEILRLLMVGELSYTTHSTTDNLLYKFFRNTGVPTGYSWNDATGQFRHYYAHYEASFTKAVAIHQGWECDRHYGGSDYTNSRDEIDRTFVPVYEAIPERWRDDVFDIFVKFGGHHHAHLYLKKIPGEVKYFVDHEKEHLLPYYFRLLRSTSPQHDLENDGAILFDLDPLGQELEALHGYTAHREESLEFAAAVIGCYESFGNRHWGNDKNFSFIAPSEEDKQEMRHVGYFNIPRIIASLENDGYSPEEIRDILALPEKYSWLKHAIFHIIEHYAEIDSGLFPGGVFALLSYLENFRSAERGAYNFVQTVTEKKLPASGLDEYLAVGTELIQRLGKSANDYFDLRSSALFSVKLLDLLRNPGVFRDAVLSGSTLAESYPFPEDGMSGDGRSTILGAFFEHYGDPQFERFLEGYRIIIARAHRKKLEPKDPEDRSTRDEYHLRRDFGEAIGHYSRVQYHFTRGNRNIGDEKSLPDIPYEDASRICLFFIFDSKTHYMDLFQRFGELVHDGIDHRISAALAVSLTDPERASFPEIEGVEFPLPKEKAMKLFGAIVESRKTVTRILHAERMGPERALEACKHTRSFMRPPKERWGYDEIMTLRKELERLEELEADPEIKVQINMERFKALIREAINFGTLQRMMNIGLSQVNLDVHETPFMRDSNPYTQMITAAVSLFAAAGVTEIPGVSEGLEELPLQNPLLSSTPSKEEEDARLALVLKDPKFESALRRNIHCALPRVERMILQARMAMPGLMPVGGKIHTTTPMNSDVLTGIRNIFGLESTPFQLIHANDSLLLPPMPSALELQLLIHILEKCGVIHSERPELQVAVGDRLHEDLAAQVGSAVLLGTSRGIVYPDNAFATTHDEQTGTRIMAYDAGVRRSGMPYDVAGAEGRTDMLGRRHYGDIGIYQLLGTLAVHEQRGERFAPLMRRFSRGFHDVLSCHGLRNSLHASAWIFDPTKNGDDPVRHAEMVNRFGNAWMESMNEPGFGIIGDVRRLIELASHEVRAQREDVIAAKPDEYEAFLRY